jgi:hypothetical protein
VNSIVAKSQLGGAFTIVTFAADSVPFCIPSFGVASQVSISPRLQFPAEQLKVCDVFSIAAVEAFLHLKKNVTVSPSASAADGSQLIVWFLNKAAAGEKLMELIAGAEAFTVNRNSSVPFAFPEVSLAKTLTRLIPDVQFVMFTRYVELEDVIVVLEVPLRAYHTVCRATSSVIVKSITCVRFIVEAFAGLFKTICGFVPSTVKYTVEELPNSELM